MLLMTMVVRNEADILRDNLEHHLRLGVGHFVIQDNGSTDGTSEYWRISPAAALPTSSATTGRRSSRKPRWRG